MYVSRRYMVPGVTSEKGWERGPSIFLTILTF